MPFRKTILFIFASLVLLSFDRNVFSSDYKPFTDHSQLTGQYYQGDGLGFNKTLNLSANGTFSYDWTGCLGTYDENQGPFRLEEGVLILSPQKKNIRKSFKVEPARFLPVAWGPRLYLIPEKEILDFVNEINQGGEPRNGVHGRFYLRSGDEQKPVEGFPLLPAAQQEKLLDNPVTGTVIKVEKKKIAVLNIGKKHGLKEGMLLTARNPNDTRFTQLKVISVEDETCTAEKLYRDDKVQEGDSVSTRFFSAPQ